MADLPKYAPQAARKQPAVEATGFQKAGFNAASGALSSLGSSIASASALEMAKEAGAQAGSNPGGQMLIPGFTQADKAFLEAYKYQEQIVVGNQVDKYINDLSFEASKDPTDQSYKDFLEQAHSGVGQMVASATSDTERSIMNAATSKIDNVGLQLQQKIWDKNQKELRAQQQLSQSNALRDMSDLAASGNTEGAIKAKERARALNNSEGNAHFTTGAERADFNQNLEIAYKAATAVGDVAGLLRAGKEEEAIQRQAAYNDVPPTQESLSISKAVNSYMANYESTRAGMEYLNFTRAQTDLNLGKPLAEVQATYNLSAADREHLRLIDSRREDSQSKAIAHHQEAMANRNNAGYLDRMGAKKINDAHTIESQLIAQAKGLEAPTLVEQVEAAINMNTTVPQLMTEMSGNINHGTPESAVQTYQLMRGTAGNRNFVLDPAARAKYANWNKYASAGRDPYQSYLEAEKAAQITPEIKKIRDEKLASIMSDAKVGIGAYGVGGGAYGQSRRINYIASQLDINKAQVGEELLAKYTDLVTTSFNLNGDWDAATADANGTINKLYKKTVVNGQEQFMPLAPNLYMQDTEFLNQKIRQDVVNKLQANTDKQLELYKNGQLEYYDKVTDTSQHSWIQSAHKVYEKAFHPYQKSLIQGEVNPDAVEGYIEVERVYKDGTVLKGVANIWPDAKSLYTNDLGALPDYGVQFEYNGIQMPIQDMNKGLLPLRWRPDEARIQAINLEHNKEERLKTLTPEERDIVAEEKRLEPQRLQAEDEATTKERTPKPGRPTERPTKRPSRGD